MRCKRRKESKFYARMRGLRLIPHEAVEKIMRDVIDKNETQRRDVSKSGHEKA